MKTATFVKQFEHLAEAPSGIAKLRELILQLAVRGKLVPQEPDDEPASELLKRIQAEKQRLIAEGVIRRAKNIPPIESDEAPYGLPVSWEWSRIRHVTHDCGQTVPQAEFSYIDVGAIDGAIGRISDSVSVVAPEDAPSRARKLVKLGTVIYSTVRPYLLNVAVVDGDFTPAPIVSTAFAVLHPFTGIDSRYLFHYLRSTPFIEYVKDAMTGMAYPAINDAKMSVGPVPIPPLEEQERIVAKVDELMALCDDLEAKQQAKRTKKIALNRASLHALTSPNGASLAAAWHRVRDHFDHLYTCPETVADLRQTILQLAVMGRLVPQNPKDEPASQLLKKIQAEKHRLIAEGTIRKSQPMPPICSDELPSELPRGWEWMRFANLGYFLGGGTPSKSNPQLWGGSILWVTPKDMKVPRIRESQDTVADLAVSASSIRMIPARALLMVVRGMILQHSFPVAIAEIQLTINQDMKAVVPYMGGMEDFLLKLLQGYRDRVLDLVERSTHGTCRLSSDRLFGLCIPLPPLAEQRRIVAKVDQLMALCDDLESKLQQTQTDAGNLLTAIVHMLVGSSEGNAGKSDASLTREASLEL